MTSKTKTTITATDEPSNTATDECAATASRGRHKGVEEEETMELISDEEYAEVIDSITSGAVPEHREGMRKLMEEIIARIRAEERAEREY